MIHHLCFLCDLVQDTGQDLDLILQEHEKIMTDSDSSGILTSWESLEDLKNRQQLMLLNLKEPGELSDQPAEEEFETIDQHQNNFQKQDCEDTV